MSSKWGRNACAARTTYEPAGYSFPSTVNAEVARSTITPFSSSAFTNFVAVGKSA